MGLPRAMVDVARVLYEVEDPEGGWIDGAPPAIEQHGPWFNCRLTPTMAADGSPGNRNYRLLTGDAELMFLPIAADNSPLPLRPDNGRLLGFDAGNRVEVKSESDPTRHWYVSSGLVVMRRRRGVVGWRVGLTRGREPQVIEQTPLPAAQTDDSPPGPSVPWDLSEFG